MDGPVAEKWPIDLSKSTVLFGPELYGKVDDNDTEQRGIKKSRKALRMVAMMRKHPKLSTKDRPKLDLVVYPKRRSETVQDGRQMTWDARLKVKK